MSSSEQTKDPHPVSPASSMPCVLEEERPSMEKRRVSSKLLKSIASYTESMKSVTTESNIEEPQSIIEEGRATPPSIEEKREIV